jgi:hypothetical protein
MFRAVPPPIIRRGRRLLGRPRSRWEDIIKIDRQEVVWEGIDWIDLAQDRNKYRFF